mmetsp:Transcript_44154/g.106401  ORF Transcript_44154/g.106401 Transcript_44154/m.106401 type:complete len:182 (+) Transcript_44154:276-821(+)|eukprot:CAMPEP_0113632114 /NCGR_PEP_ID=MMETSP0017_2-20120614/16689_1 /TAXON_ID=2856 /ORGANISM="Cylindrotheca closterium" /LENGTH=181 /DNA_ID=CAMNT_0000542651 /DNA_START=145 /DNA_END=690 /DNA_ORIENTATION=- /assembly_acc=CAM_ASM_000147
MMKKASTSILFTLAATASVFHANFQQVQAFPMSPSSLHRPLHSNFNALQSSAADELELSLSPELQSQLEEKNASRKKFGLKPLSLSEFMELQAQVAQMHQQQELKFSAAQSESKQVQQQQQPSFMKTFSKGLLEDTCMSSFDCESPKVCCDLGFKKMCCSNGMLEVALEYAMVPVPVDMRE